MVFRFSKKVTNFVLIFLLDLTFTIGIPMSNPSKRLSQMFWLSWKIWTLYPLQFPNEILNFGSLWNWQSRHRVERIWAKCWHHLSSRASQSILLMVSSNQFWLSWLRISDQWFTMAHEQYTGASINFIWLGVVHKWRHSKINECLGWCTAYQWFTF